MSLDVDGTLLTSEHSISDKTINSLRRCIDQGIKIVFASGRLYSSLAQYIKLFDLKTEQISLNGAVIVDPQSKQKVKELGLDLTEYQLLINKLRELKIPFVIFDSDSYYQEQDWSKMKILEKITGTKVKKISNYEQIDTPIKVLAMIKEAELVTEIKKFNLPDSIEFIKTGDIFFEFHHSAVSKGVALKYIAEKYNISSEEILAIGDSENDIEMINYAGKGIAMDNALDQVKEVCDYVTCSNDENGVANALAKYIG